MKENLKNRLHRKDILTIPNFLSLFRLALIPAIVLFYLRDHRYASVGIILLSAFTDIVDGYIARRFNMVSDFGKFLDPVADKLTQIAMLCCLILRYPWAILLVALLILKELFQLTLGIVVLKKTNVINSAQWFGKLNTVVLYITMILLFLFPGIPQALSELLFVLCTSTMLFSMLLYGRFFRLAIKRAESSNEKESDTTI